MTTQEIEQEIQARQARLFGNREILADFGGSSNPEERKAAELAEEELKKVETEIQQLQRALEKSRD